MEITTRKQGEASIVALVGRLDSATAPNAQQALEKIVSGGAQKLAVDFSKLDYISSAGLVALHSVALLVKGEELPDTEQGWSTYRSMGRTSASGVQSHIKLLNPSEEVRNVLDMVGFGNVFQVYTDLDEAVQSF